jgi:hypothetical protein
MSDVFAPPDDYGQLSSSDVHTSLGESLSAQAGESFGSGLKLASRTIEYLAAEHGWSPMLAGFASQQPWLHPDAPDVPIAEARQRVKDAGLENEMKLPDGQDTIRAPVLDLMMNAAHERQQTAAAVARGPQGFIPDALGFATQIGAGMIDPVNMAAFSIPVLGEARYGKILAGAGDSIAKRLALRTGIGAAQGAVGGAALAPADWWLHTQDGQDYTFADALKSVALSAGMGAAAHGGGGLAGDVFSRLRGRVLPGSPDDLRARAVAGDESAAAALEQMGTGLVPPIGGTPLPEQAFSPEGIGADEVPGLSTAPATASPLHPAEVLADLPERVREDVTRAAAADVINGTPVRAGELLQEAAKEDPRVAESVRAPATLSAAARELPPLHEGAQIVGQGPHGPVIDGYQNRWPDVVDWMRRAETGDAREVLSHSDVPEPIDVIWGDHDPATGRGYGLAHIAALHPEVLPDLPERLARMRVVEETNERIQLESPDGTERAAVAKNFHGEPKTWLLTAFERGRRRGGDTSGSPSGLPDTTRSSRPPRGGPGDQSGLRPAADLRSPLSPYYGGEGAGPPRTMAETGAIDNSHDVVSGANSSKDPNGPVYIDRRIPQFSPKLKDRNGQPANLWKYLAVHERVEADAMRDGMSYDHAHSRFATPAERAAVAADGVDWNAYTHEIDGYLDRIEHERAENPPPDTHVDPQAAIGHHRSENKGAPELGRETRRETFPGRSPEARETPGAADWRSLQGRRADDPDLAEVSAAAVTPPRAVAAAPAAPAPAPPEPAKAVSAAEQAAADAEKLLSDILPKLTAGERKSFEDTLANLENDRAAREQILRDGAACLAAAAA